MRIQRKKVILCAVLILQLVWGGCGRQKTAESTEDALAEGTVLINEETAVPRRTEIEMPVEISEEAAEKTPEPSSSETVEEETPEPSVPEAAVEGTPEPSAPETAVEGTPEPSAPETAVEQTPEPSAPETAVEQTPAPTHTHVWDAGVVTAATCGKEGTKTYSCSCGEKKSEMLAATGEHTWVFDFTWWESACDMNGYEAQRCSVCGATQSIETQKKEHAFVCTEEGCGAVYTRYDCKNCPEWYEVFEKSCIDADGDRYCDIYDHPM